MVVVISLDADIKKKNIHSHVEDEDIDSQACNNSLLRTRSGIHDGSNIRILRHETAEVASIKGIYQKKT